MRKSTSRTKSRLLYTGASVAAIAAGALVAPVAAFAYDLTSATPNVGPGGTTVTVVAPASSFGSSAGFILTTLTACPALYTTTAASPAVSVAGASPTVSSATNATFVVPTTAAPNTYNICAYAGTGATSALLNASTPTLTFKVVPTSAISPTAGASGGGNGVSVTLPSSLAWNTVNSAVFVPATTPCPSTYGSPAATSLATITPNSGSTTAGSLTVPVGVSGSLSAATPYNVCIYTGGTVVSGTTLASVGSAAYNVSLPPVTLNNSIGSATANLVVSSANNFLTGATSPALIATSGVCPGVYGTPGANTYGLVLKSANNRGAFALPSGGTWNPGTTYNVCIYAGTGATNRLLANAAYTVATPPSLSGVLPAGGSSLGGDFITVTGTNLPTAPGSITATLGGLPLNNITPVDATTFTAVTPTHAAQAGVPLTVSTATGTTTLTPAFDYVNGIDVSPNTAPNTATAAWVDVKGVGFSSLAFSAAGIVGDAATTAARVFLVKGQGACTGNTTSCVGTDSYAIGASNPAVAECATPSVISDNELFCKLNLASGAITIDATSVAAATITTVPNGTYTLTVVSNGKWNATGFTQSVISSGSTFTVAPF
ncbi:MAG TPA: IPT/TIG domain-containing protein [Actinoplanes sp.]|jgi:hypothetical protein